MNVQDDLYLGSGFTVFKTTDKNPTMQQGCGPLGRIAFLDIVPLTKQTNNVALAAHLTNGTPMTLAAGTGTTAGTAPDGTAVILFDVARAVSLTSSAAMNTIAVTIKGYDKYWQPMTQTITLPSSGTTENTTKAFYAIASVTPNGTDNTNTLAVGTSDIFGLDFASTDAGFIIPKWAETLAQDAGTFVAADQTIPATAATGDVRGTYTPSSSSNGTRRLVVWQHLVGSQCGSTATEFTYVNGATVTVTGALGVQQV